MHGILSTILLVASITPTKSWFPPERPLTVNVKAGGGAELVLTDFAGKILEPTGPAEVSADATVDLHEVFHQVRAAGTYVLFLTEPGAARDRSHAPTEFIGTPLVITAREFMREGAPTRAMVTKVEPLRYAVMRTEHGDVSIVFYYDSAPNTSANFLTLAEQGFYDGLTFHKILPRFVIQGGDPTGSGVGGSGFTIDAEFSRRPHKAGVLSMARSPDPLESTGIVPRREFADSASSQFFICLDDKAVAPLDMKYTAFGEVAAGMEAVRKIAGVPLVDARSGAPRHKPVIEKVEVRPVTAADNPYAGLFKPAESPLRGSPLREGAARDR